MNSIFIIKLANKYRCELCDYTTNYDKELNAHKKTHKQKKLEKFVAKKLPPNSSMYSMAKSAYRLSMNTSSKFRTLPDFLIFGESKCGTNSLYANLIEHPKIPPFSKGIHFFDAAFDNGVGWYKQYFPPKWKKKDQLNGESSPYLNYPHSAKRVFSVVPDVKLVAILRNPIDRAYSSWKMETEFGYENLSFEEGIKEEENRIGKEIEKVLENENYWSLPLFRYSYLERGKYAKNLKSWFEIFPKDQFLIISSEDFSSKPQETVNNIFQFLNLSTHTIRNLEKKNVRKAAKMNEKTRNELIEFFKPHNERLFKMINKKFDWDK